MKSDFDSVGDFHQKFGLPNTTHAGPAPQEIDPRLRDFRLKFILEELQELCDGYGLELSWSLDPKIIKCPKCTEEIDCGECCNGSIAVEPSQDLAKIADALVDLAYVTLGTAHVHRLPWAELFAEVQRANVTKERCGIDHRYEGDGVSACEHLNPDGLCGADRWAHSLRGSAHDVIKPRGWTAPDIIGVLMAAGWKGPKLPMERESMYSPMSGYPSKETP